MNSDNGQYQELFELMETLCESRLTSEQTTRLEEIVVNDPAARQVYLKYIDLHGTLHWDTAISAVDDPEIPIVGRAKLDLATTKRGEPSRTKPSRPSPTAVVVISACLLLALFGMWAFRSFAPADNVGDVAKKKRTDAPDNPDSGSTITRRDAADNKIADVHRSKTSITLRKFKDQAPEKPDGKIASKTDIPKQPIPESVDGGTPGTGSSKVLISFINERIRAEWKAEGIEASPAADDAEWVRRVYLDIVGHIPPVSDAEEFLNDKDPNKRSVLIDRLLDDPGYVRNWTTIWTNLLIGRSNSRDVNRPALRKYLREGFARNRPWNQVVYDFVSAEGDFEEHGETNFLLAHLNNEAVPATAITARLFLGTQVQCTQCHDHPFNDWEQNQFWELNSFFQQTGKVRRKIAAQTAKMTTRTELVRNKVGGLTYYQNRRGVMKAARPIFAGVAISTDQETNRRLELAKLITSGKKPLIAEALVNRMWGHFFGHGFTRPVDDMGPHNLPTHPQVLDRMATEFVRSGYDLKQVIRWICNCDAYQLTSSFGDSNSEDDPGSGAEPFFSRMYVKSMTAEQLYDSLLVATGAHRAAGSDWTAVEEKRQDWLQQFVMAFQTEENDEATTFDGTITQALMMMNSDLIQAAVGVSRGTYLEQVARERTGEVEKVKKLCLSALSRYPTPQEIAVIKKLLREQASRRPRSANPRLATIAGLQDVFWAYLNSNEFILVH